ncbi:MAG TPA: hypothetical protein VIL55_16740 [Naasia sp.]|jgi:uncharacterized protein (DUF58 family)
MNWRIFGIALVAVFLLTLLLTGSWGIALGVAFVLLILGALASSLVDLGRVPAFRTSQATPEDQRAEQRRASGEDI